MKTKNQTKKALLMSAMSLLLCFSMLIGTTFAWFTDSVSSANNIIVAGNLDVELYYQLEDETTWTKVTETTNVFKEDTLWEPGHTEVVKLKVVNEGSLALKYNLGVNVASEVGSVNMTGKNFLLSEFIKFAVIDGANTYTRDEAIAAAEAAGATALKTAYNSGTTQLLVDDAATTDVKENEKIVTMVVYMPTTVGNEANPAKGAATPTINLGINLFATQIAYEEDSYDNQYDADAITIVKTATEAQAALDNATAGTIIKLAPGVNYGTLTFKANPGNSNTTEVDIADAWRYNYVRSIEDITIVGAPGAKVDGIIFATGAQPGDCNNTAVIKNLVIDGVEFTDALTASPAGYNAPIMITTSNATVDGLTVKNCTLVGDNDKLQLVYLYAADGSKNVTITGNTVDGIARLCELRGTENVTITNNTIKNTAEHAMLLAGAAYSGTVTITGNTAYAIGDRFVRMAGGENATVVIKDNTITNYMGGDPDYIKVTDASNVVINDQKTIENNVMATEVYGLTLIPNGENSKIIVNDKEGFLNLTKLSNDWAELFTDGNGNEVGNYVNGAGVDYYYSHYWTVILEADIDLGNQQISPVLIELAAGTGASHFDGKGHTIKNAVIVTDPTTQNGAGLFDNRRCDFKNLKLDNIHVTGSNVGGSTAGVLAGDCNFAIDNITITNSSVTGGKYTGGVVGYGYTNITNCTLTNVTVKGGYKLGGVIGYIVQENGKTANVTGNTLTDCTVDGIGGGVFAGGKTEYVAGKVVGNYNANGDCNNNTVTNMATTDATANIGKIEAGCTVNQ